MNDRPVRYYKLNDANGPNAFESVGTGSYGTYDGPVFFAAPGPLLDETSSGIALDAGAYDVGVKIPAALTAAGSFSIETWVRPRLNRTYLTIWGTSPSHRLLVNSGGYLLSQFGTNVYSKGALTNDGWHHVVFVYDASTATQLLYIDGSLDSSAPLAASAATFTAPYYLGQYDTSGNYKWHGGLALHAVYAYALTASQVQAHYNAAGYPPASPTPAPTPAGTPPPDAPCAGYRWTVKVATDAAASSISLSPIAQTMEWLTGIPQPNTNNALARMRPAEISTYEIVNATLTQAYTAGDRDYHLALKDALGTAMIAESPDPSCAPQSVLYSEMTAVHNQIHAQYPNISSTPMPLNQPVSLEGIAFFDYVPNFATGEASNGIELHPILSICFGTNCALSPPVTPTPSPPPSPSPSPTPTATPAPSPSSAYASAVLADAPREYYKFNESGGTTFSDSSGNARNGTYVGAVTFGVPGPLLDEPSTAVSLAGGSASAGALAPN
ncbi:MAG TPA: LamG domain-containing protein, partial [Candidatus Baltobacteraceae bacterium]|nr:LamG domain-containing protein [Candidatus Baltobacteraceae bacterium]